MLQSGQWRRPFCSVQSPVKKKTLILYFIRCSSVGIATRLRDGWSGVLILVGATDICSPKRLDRQWGPTCLLLNGCRGCFSGYSVRGVKLTTQLYLVLMLGMDGAMPLLLLYAFMAWTVKTLSLYRGRPPILHPLRKNAFRHGSCVKRIILHRHALSRNWKVLIICPTAQ